MDRPTLTPADLKAIVAGVDEYMDMQSRRHLIEMGEEVFYLLACRWLADKGIINMRED